MSDKKDAKFYDHLREKSLYVRQESLKIHKIAQDTRIASSLSAVETFVVLYYGKIMRFDPKNLGWEDRDRFIISKGHGSISFFPVLADMGFFTKEELTRVCKKGSFLGGIPDCIIPGYETTNGSLGHGLGVGCGIAVALKKKNNDRNVYVMVGDGELYEGSNWEAVMFAAERGLDNLVLIVDNNKICMLDYCKKIIDISPLEEKFGAFKWDVTSVDGHDVKELYEVFTAKSSERNGKPKVIIANTVKGKGVPELEGDPLNHIRNIDPAKIDDVIGALK